MKLTGTLIHYGKKNLNGRIYSEDLARDIVKEFNERQSGPIPDRAEDKEKYIKMVAKQRKKVLGQLGYPENGMTDLSKVSHEVEEIHLNEENSSIDGTIKILDTPNGDIVSKMIKEMMDGDSIGLCCRPRGTGTVNENGELENYDLISFDIVSSDKDAFANIKKDDNLKPLKKDE